MTTKTKAKPKKPAWIKCKYSSLVEVEKLVPNPRNPNHHPEHQVKLLAKILDFQGWRLPIVVSKLSGFIVRGHGRLLAAKVLGHDLLPVDFQEYESEAQEWADLVADNRIAELAELDASGLKDIIEELDTGEIDLEVTGFDQEELTSLMSQFFQEEEGLTDDDAIPDEVEARTQLGDLWKLGNHRLLCGDSTDRANVEKVLGGGKPALMVTDPPYGIGIDGQKRDVRKNTKHSRKAHKFLHWDSAAPTKETFDSLISFASKSLIWGGNYFTHCLPPTKGWVVWDKGQKGLTMSDGELAWTSENIPLRIYVQDRNGLKGSIHPTQKPLSIILHCINHLGNVGDVFDPFLGSGTTLIACEKLKRTCYGLELSPEYCDLLMQRWEVFTGLVAQKVS